MVTQEVELPLAPTALLTRCAHRPFAVALDGGNQQSWGVGRALLGFAPRATLRVLANGDAVVREQRAHRWHGDPFALLDRFCREWGGGRTGATPFAGGVVAALSYELRHWVEPRLGPRRTEMAMPVLHAAAYDWLLSYSYPERRYRLASAWRSRTELQTIAAELQVLAAAAPPRPVEAAPVRPQSDFTKDEYLQAVRTALDYIAAGDAYQINLAQRFVVTSAAAPAALFAAMQRHVAPFGAYVDAGGVALVSNSPECFLTLQDGVLSTFPIKGTRRRGADARSDRALVDELQRDAKERAEHLMIVDLERSDLGRVCRTGSVRVAEFAAVHTLPSVHHLVSKVSGTTREGIGLADILRATFPGGSITGAPKVRAMEIIDELEPVPRGFYTGAIGFIDGTGNAVFSLAIRTAIATHGTFAYHAGGGIVADSVPALEYDETLLKAQPFFAALSAPAV